MTLHLSSGAWLAELVEFELGAWDPAAARERLPTELLDARIPLDARARILATRSLRRVPAEPDDREAFQARFQGHIQLALDLALLVGSEEPAPQRRAGLAAILAATAGEVSRAMAAGASRPGAADERAVERALQTAASAFVESSWPPGDPRWGLALSGGELALERNLVARLAALRWRRGRLDEAAVRRRIEQAGNALALLVEVLAAQASAAGRMHASGRKAVRHQVARLRLPRETGRWLRDALRAPRPAAELCRAAPPRLRAFLAEQLLVAAEASRPRSLEADAFAEAFLAEAGLGEGVIPALRADAALQAGTHRWQEGPGEWVPGEIQGLPPEWGDAADEMVEKVGEVFSDNLDAIVREVRQTGELGQLLAKAAGGKPLDADERRRVKTQLIDLAKVVPALAIFAAPGGMLLLPLLAKLLPWNVLPSAWDPKAPRTPQLPGKRRGVT